MVRGPFQESSMQFMIAFKETTAEVSRRDDPAASPAYWGAWGAYVEESQIRCK